MSVEITIYSPKTTMSGADLISGAKARGLAIRLLDASGARMVPASGLLRPLEGRTLIVVGAGPHDVPEGEAGDDRSPGSCPDGPEGRPGGLGELAWCVLRCAAFGLGASEGRPWAGLDLSGRPEALFDLVRMSRVRATYSLRSRARPLRCCVLLGLVADALRDMTGGFLDD